MADNSSRAGKQYFDAEILKWSSGLHAPHDAALERAFVSPQQFDIPAIQLAPSEGKLVELLLRLISARRVVEVGTLVGYSALRLARALPPDGHVWTIESDKKHAHIARDNIAAAGESARITVVEGTGADALPTLEKHGPFCAVFVDADKESYPLYGRWAAAHLRPGGLLLGDNAFLFGELLQNTPRAQAMRTFHEDAARALDTVCIPTPDGLLLGRKR